MENILTILLLMILTSGNINQTTKSENEPLNSKELTKNKDSQRAAEWLVKSIEEFYKQPLPKKMADITTERYAEYKQDAICVEYDGLTLEQFKQKWDTVYNVTYAGVGGSFLTGQQDEGTIKVSECRLKASNRDIEFIFNVIISDTQFKLDHKREITVVKTDQGFKIDDVKEFN